VLPHVLQTTSLRHFITVHTWDFTVLQQGCKVPKQNIMQLLKTKQNNSKKNRFKGREALPARFLGRTAKCCISPVTCIWQARRGVLMQSAGRQQGFPCGSSCPPSSAVRSAGSQPSCLSRSRGCRGSRRGTYAASLWRGP